MAIKRIRGRELQYLRERHFRSNPLCVECLKSGVVEAARELDHIIPLHKGGTNDPSNLQGLCVVCHEIKSISERGYKRKQRIGVDGFPVDDPGGGCKSLELFAWKPFA